MKSRGRPIIDIRKAWKIYDVGTTKVYALRGMNLSIKRGEFVAIMGPSGSGKCVGGETRIMLADGSLSTIENLYKNKEKNKKILCFNFNKGKIISSEIEEYHRREDSILKIKTSSGKTINVTREHPFFSISDKGLSELRAEELDKRYIAIPRDLVHIKGKSQNLDTLSLLSSESDIFIADSKQLFRKLTFNKNVRNKICSVLNINTARYDAWMNYNDIPLSEFRNITNLLGMNISEFEKYITYFKQSNTKNKIKLQYKTNKLLLEAYGYIAGDGWLDRDGIKISNIDDILKQRMKFVFKKIFDIEATGYIPTRLNFCSTTLRYFFRNVFNMPEKQKARNIVMPDFIYSCPNEEISYFLRALFDCDSHVRKSKNEIEITLASRNFVNALIPLFLRFGIVARYSEVMKKATNSKMKLRKYYRLSISGLSNLIKYKKNIGFLSPAKIKRLNSRIKQTKRADTNVDIIPCTMLIRNIRRNLKISLKRIKKRYGKNFWQLEGTNRKPTLKTVEFILDIFKNRLKEIKDMNPSFKLAKDIGFSKNEFKTIEEIKNYIKKVIKESSVLINELENICKISKNVFWDKVDSIKGTSKDYVYDLTVKDYHNFIANEIIVHNSTAVNMVGCLDIPTTGQIYLEGKNIAHMGESELAQIRGQKIGFVFQQFNLLPTLNAIENVMLPMIFQGKSKEERLKRGTYLLEMVELGDRMNHRPTELSGGQQQRVAMARALANDPDIILADEPTGNLDTKTGEMVIKMLRRLHSKEKKTIIMVTHDSYVAKYAQRIARLRDGKIIRGG